MVENTRKTLRVGACRPVNTPEEVRVEENSSGLPLAVAAPSRQVVAAIEDRWRLDDEWWRQEPIARLYYAVRLASGQQLVLYKDLANGRWYRQSY
jgi:hypothetical protein